MRRPVVPEPVRATSLNDPDDVVAVAELLGRQPRGEFRVVVRDDAGVPVVIRNQPLLHDGTPMPTLYWLVDRDLNRRIGRLEAAGGVRRAEAEVDPTELADAHERYRSERTAELPEDWSGPRPFGGVGGTRRGVKCLHTHYAWHLAGGDDPVGRWVGEHLDGRSGHEHGHDGFDHQQVHDDTEQDHPDHDDPTGAST